jgi:hypothetical protein
VTATYRINGNELALGFASGTATVWNPRTPTLVQAEERLSSRAVLWSDTETAATGSLLERLVELLCDEGQPLVLSWLVGHLLAGDGDVEPILQAVDVAELWGLIAIDEQPGRRRRRQSANDGSEDRLERSVVTVTQAGLVWHNATETAARERDRRRKAMGRGGDHSINLTGSFAGPVTVAGRDVR